MTPSGYMALRSKGMYSLPEKYHSGSDFFRHAMRRNPLPYNTFAITWCTPVAAMITPGPRLWSARPHDFPSLIAQFLLGLWPVRVLDMRLFILHDSSESSP